MKKSLLSIIFVTASVSLSSATTSISAINYVGGTGATAYAQQVLTSAAGNVPFVGTLQIGTFSSPAGLSTTTGEISLATFGWSLFASTPFNTSTNQRGLFGATAATGLLPTTTAVGANSPFFDNVTGEGKNIFAVVANAAGTDFIIWRSSSLFAPELEGTGGLPISFFTNNAATTLARGTVVPAGNNGLLGSVSTQNGKDAVTFGVVPEPSAMLLGLVGALGLLRRRRN